MKQHGVRDKLENVEIKLSNKFNITTDQRNKLTQCEQTKSLNQLQVPIELWTNEQKIQYLDEMKLNFKKQRLCEIIWTVLKLYTQSGKNVIANIASNTIILPITTWSD